MGTQQKHKQERKRAKRARQKNERNYQMHLKLKALKHAAGPNRESFHALQKLLGI